MATPLTFDAIVLCGGEARRLGGTDKAGIVVGGRTLLERALASVDSADKVVAVGPTRQTTSAVVWTREDPPGGGPVCGIAAGLQEVNAETVVILGVDFPFVDRAGIDSMVQSFADGDGVILADEDGRPQFLVGAYRRASLVRVLKDRDPRDMAVKELVAGLALEMVIDPRAARDCDTWEDITAVDELIR